MTDPVADRLGIERVLNGVAHLTEILPIRSKTASCAGSPRKRSLPYSVLDRETPRYRSGRRVFWGKPEVELHIVEHQVTKERDWLAELVDATIRRV